MTVRTVRLYAAALAALLSLAAPPAIAMDSIGEEFGNAPVRGGTGLTPGLLSILNDTHRVYLYRIDSDGFKSFTSGYFQGGTAAANDALRRFAALEKGLEVVLLPGPREVPSFQGKRKVSADWELHIPVPGGLGGRSPVAVTKPTLYLYVRALDRPAVPATPAQVARWLAELDAEKFKDRERAAGELEKQGVAVTAALRKALEGKPPAEARRRIGMLLAKLDGPGVNLGVLAVPEGVRVLGPDDLLARNREGLKSANVRVRGEVATLMTRFGPDPAALATLIQMLENKEAHARQHAVRVLGGMGKSAAPALPALRAGLDDPVPYVRTDCKDAIAAIEAAKEEPDAAERAAKAKVVREEIGRFVKGRTGDEALVKKELAALRGNWNVVEGAAKNQDVNTQFSIVEDSLRIGIGGNFKDFRIRINPAKDPKEIDLITLAPDGSDKSMLGIYKLEGDTLKVCFDDFGKKRPTEFKAKADSKQSMYVMKREKKKDK